MTTFHGVMAALTAIFAGISAWLFRQGGPYNPVPRETAVKRPGEESTPETINDPSPPQNAQQRPTAPRLSDLLAAMRDFEGGPSDANYRNHNPLNYRFSPIDYLPKYEPVKKSPAGFAIFKDYSTGWLYAFEDKKHKIAKHPTWTIADLVADHAPSSENPTDRYIAYVCRRLSVDKTFPVRDLVIA